MLGYVQWFDAPSLHALVRNILYTGKGVREQLSPSLGIPTSISSMYGQAQPKLKRRSKCHPHVLPSFCFFAGPSEVCTPATLHHFCLLVCQPFLQVRCKEAAGWAKVSATAQWSWSTHATPYLHHSPLHHFKQRWNLFKQLSRACLVHTWSKMKWRSFLPSKKGLGHFGLLREITHLNVTFPDMLAFNYR